MVSRLLRYYFRHCDHRGKYRLARWLGRTVIPDRGLPVRVYPGVELLLHPRDWIEYVLLTRGEYEPLTLRFLADNLAPGQSAVLAGVNFGLHVAAAARAVGDAGRVVGVEPQPAALLRAYANLSRNGLWGPVRLLSAALASAPGVRHMSWSDPGNPGAASFYQPGAGIEVQMTTLDAVVAELVPGRPRVLLLDVQGYELQALLGLTAASTPDLAVVEFDPEFLDKAGVRPHDLHARLAELGYAVHSLHGEPVPAGRVDVPERNLVGVRPGAAVRWAPGPAA